MAKMRPLVLLAQPLYGAVPPDAHSGLMTFFGKNQAGRWLWHPDQMELVQLAPDHPQYADAFPLLCGYTAFSNGYVDWARNQIVERIRTHYPMVTHVFFSDQDVTYPDDTIKRLLEADADVVSGIYYGKDNDHTPVAFESLEPKPLRLEHVDLDALQQVAGVGMGACLIRMSLFEEMAQFFGDHDWFRCGRTGKHYRGEDYHFSLRCREMGVSIWLDGRVHCGHIGDCEITHEHRTFHEAGIGPKFSESRRNASDTPPTILLG